MNTEQQRAHAWSLMQEANGVLYDVATFFPRFTATTAEDERVDLLAQLAVEMIKDKATDAYRIAYSVYHGQLPIRDVSELDLRLADARLCLVVAHGWYARLVAASKKQEEGQ